MFQIKCKEEDDEDIVIDEDVRCPIWEDEVD